MFQKLSSKTEITVLLIHLILDNAARHVLYVSLTQASEMSRGLFKCTTAEAVQRLVKKGANVDERRADGATPLMVHAELGNGEVVKELIRLNANVDLQDEVCGVMCVCKWGWLWVFRCRAVDVCMFSGAQGLII